MTEQLIKDLLGTILYTWGFSYIYGLSDASRPAGIGCGLVGWLSYRLLIHLGGQPIPAAFVATTLLAFYAELMARKLKKPATSFLLMGLLTLVPGGSIYQSILNIVNGDSAAATSYAIEAFGLATALAMGVVFVTSMFRLRPLDPEVRLQRGQGGRKKP